VSILNPLFEAVAWVIMRIHAVLAVPFGASSGWAWGLSIVLLVVLMRALMVPLFVKQVNAQRKMQAHMPQLQEIRKRYKNDKQRLNEETMKFYRENGINPLGGCLPLVAQLPLFWALFNVLRGISNWQPGHTPPYGLTVPVVASARAAHIFGASLADKFLFPLPHESWSSRIVILVFVMISAGTTFLTMRQSARRGMMQQTTMDPDNPAANMQKYMMYIAPFFALTGLYWQFGLVIYWVTTNVWTLGQQHILFRNLPVVGSATVGASAVQAASGNTGVSGKSNSGKVSGSVKAALTGKKDEPQDSVPKAGAQKTSVPKAGVARTAAPKPSASKPSAPKPSASKPSAPKPSANGSSVPGATAPAAAATGGARGLLRFGKAKPEPEAVPAAPQTKTVRQQPTRQTRSKRSGKR
jgi:YidC/Oxa1 family membrane protein insertase